MEKQMNIPVLRFSEFEGEWEEKRLEELFDEFKSGQGITSTYINETGLYPVYGGNGLRGFCDNYTHDGSYFLIGRQGALCGNIISVEGKVYISEHAIACKANINSETSWLAKRLDYLDLNRLSESSAQPGLAVNKLLRLKLKVPKKPEQTKIATFLTAIDSRLTQLKQKKSHLELYKKGVMQKIFEQEIRFKDEDGNEFPDWEEKKLGEVMSIPIKQKPKVIDKLKILTVKLHLKGIFKNERTDGLSIGSTIYYVRNKGQFIYGKQNLFNGAFGIIPEEFDGFLSSGDVPALDFDPKKLINKFLFYFMSRESFYRKLEDVATGSGSKRIHEEILLNVEFKLPCLQEQTKIANFLSAIDEKISLCGQQIEKTEQWKKGLLQQMFC